MKSEYNSETGRRFGPGDRRTCVADRIASALPANAPYSRTLADLVFEPAERYGQRPAVICGDRLVCYAELARRAACIAAVLRSRGIARGGGIQHMVQP